MFARQALYPLNYLPASERALFKLDYLCKDPSLLACLSLESGNVVPKKPPPQRCGLWVTGGCSAERKAHIREILELSLPVFSGGQLGSGVCQLLNSVSDCVTSQCVSFV